MNTVEQQIGQNNILKFKIQSLADSIDEASLLMLEINEELLRTEKDLEESERYINNKIVKLARKAVNIPMLQLVMGYKGEKK